MERRRGIQGAVALSCAVACLLLAVDDNPQQRFRRQLRTPAENQRSVAMGTEDILDGLSGGVAPLASPLAARRPVERLEGLGKADVPTKPLAADTDPNIAPPPPFLWPDSDFFLNPSAIAPVAPRPPRSPAPRVAKRVFDTRAPQRSVVRMLRARDARIGMSLPGAGLIGDALASAIRRRAPVRSTSTFVARVASDGEVVRIAVRSFVGGSVGARKAACGVALANLAGKQLPLPHHLRGGAWVTVLVTQGLEMPSGRGRRPSLRGRSLPDESWLFEPKPRRLAVREEPIVSAYDLLPPDLAGLGNPELMLSPLPISGLGRGRRHRAEEGHTGSFDLADLGSHPTLVVKHQITVTPISPGRSLMHTERDHAL